MEKQQGSGRFGGSAAVAVTGAGEAVVVVVVVEPRSFDSEVVRVPRCWAFHGCNNEALEQGGPEGWLLSLLLGYAILLKSSILPVEAE